MIRPNGQSRLWLSLLVTGCASAPLAPPSPPLPKASLLPQEVHLAELRQLTFGGENAEAYWSFDGKQLSFQSRAPEEGCDRIYQMPLEGGSAKRTRISNGQGATTCAHFLPGNEEVIFASTHLGGAACPPRPDMRLGYVWALYDSYDIFRSKTDGTGLQQLTTEKGYDAEGTVCSKDGSIVFTSTRDGDLELYRMDADGKNVKRLTHTPGYDGGAFFNHDCTKLLWRASRPRPGKELEDYQGLLSRGLVRPSKLELWVANADGSDPMQLTYLNAASFAPFWHPDGSRILFSTNFGDPKGREFDIWAVNPDGSALEQITFAPGFDGFPMFSPDGKYLAFSSNRATAKGATDTNVFVARWVEGKPQLAEESAADRTRRDVAYLADPAREGRGIGTQGLDAAGQYLERRFTELGLAPAGEEGFRQTFPAATAVVMGPDTQVSLAGKSLAPDQFSVPGFSATGEVSGPLVLAGYGITDQGLGVDDYAKLNVKGKVVVVRRFVPDSPLFAETEKQRRFGDIRYKAWNAREHGAKALLVVDLPEPPSPPKEGWQLPPEAHLPSARPEGAGDAGLPVVVVKRAALEPLLAQLRGPKKVAAKLKVSLVFEKKDVFNVVGRLGAGAPEAQRLPGVVVVGAHYDHLGMGGKDSLAPEKREPHLGADDNASGTSAMLEAARVLAAARSQLRRDVLFVGFTAEEAGVLGSTHFTKNPPGGLQMKEVVAMFNLDMVGRLRGNKVSVLGTESAQEWNALFPAACDKLRLECAGSGDGYGPSDESPFYAAGVPVLFFFTGTHFDYHKPSDSAEKLNQAGLARIAHLAAELAMTVNGQEARLTYKSSVAPAPRGDLRSFNASLGTVPDYSGPPSGQRGVLLAGVRAGGGAEKAGMRRGDILIRLGRHDVGSVEDLMYALNSAKPGETVSAVVIRDGKEVVLEATFQESKRK